LTSPALQLSVARVRVLKMRTHQSHLSILMWLICFGKEKTPHPESGEASWLKVRYWKEHLAFDNNKPGFAVFGHDGGVGVLGGL